MRPDADAPRPKLSTGATPAAAALLVTLLAFASLHPAPARAQGDAASAAAEIDRVLARKESKWRCGALMRTAVVAAPRAPRGSYYQLRCRRGDMIVVGLVFFAESEQAAARRLERSLADPQLFQGATPAALAGLGEQAYQQRRPGAASVAFRRGTLFAQVSVGLAPAEAGAPRPPAGKAVEKATDEAVKTARRFAGHLAGEKAPK